MMRAESTVGSCVWCRQTTALIPRRPKRVGKEWCAASGNGLVCSAVKRFGCHRESEDCQPGRGGGRRAVEHRRADSILKAAPKDGRRYSSPCRLSEPTN